MCLIVWTSRHLYKLNMNLLFLLFLVEKECTYTILEMKYPYLSHYALITLTVL